LNARPGKSALVPELICRDLTKSRAFYTDTLGFSVLYERAEDGFCYLALGAAEIMLEQIDADSWADAPLEPPFGRGMNFQIMTTGFAELVTVCQTANATIYKPLENVWYRAGDFYVGQTQFIVQDPDGYLLRFAEDLGSRAQPPETDRIVS
jgi:catechol 2,3-dioxygenase-like lactoylglutathione lyase family enzyme